MHVMQNSCNEIPQRGKEININLSRITSVFGENRTEGESWLVWLTCKQINAKSGTYTFTYCSKIV